VTIKPLITDKAREKVEEHLKDAMEKAALDKRGETGVLSNTDVHYYGPAANAQKTADLLNKLSNGNKYSVELQRHKYDFVGGLIDGKHYSVHSCYGLGKAGCEVSYGPAKSKNIKAQGR